MVDLQARAVITAVDNVSGPMAAMSRTFSNFGSGLQFVAKNLSSLGNQLAGVGGAMSAAITLPAEAILRSAAEHESALNTIKNAYRGSEEQFASFAKQLERLAETMPGTTEDFLAMGRAVVEANVPLKDQVDLLKIIAEHAAGMSAPYDEMAKFAVNLKNSLNLSTEGLRQQLDLLEAMAKRAGPGAREELESIMLTVGRLGKAISGPDGMVAWQAFAGILVSMGVPSSSAAMALRYLYNVVEGKVKVPAAAKQALDDLHMTIEQLREGLEKDPGAMLQKIFDTVSKMDPKQAAEVMTGLFGPRALANLAGMTDRMPEFNAQLKEYTDQQKLAADAQTDFARKAGEAKTQWENLIDTFNAIKDAIGEQWLKPFNVAASAIRDFLVNLQENHPEALRVLADGLGVLALAGPGLIIAGAGLKVASLAMSGFGTALAGVSAGGLVAIAAAVLVAYEAFKHWNDPEVKAARDNLVASFERLKSALSGLDADLGINWSAMTEGFPKDMADMINSLANALDTLAKAVETWKKAGAGKALNDTAAAMGLPRVFAEEPKPLPPGWAGPPAEAAPPGAPQTSGARGGPSVPIVPRTALPAAPAYTPIPSPMNAVPPGFFTPAPAPPLVRDMGPQAIDVTGKVVADVTGKVDSIVKGQANVDVRVRVDGPAQITGMNARDDGRNIKANVGASMADATVKP